MGEKFSKPERKSGDAVFPAVKRELSLSLFLDSSSISVCKPRLVFGELCCTEPKSFLIYNKNMHFHMSTGFVDQ